MPYACDAHFKAITKTNCILMEKIKFVLWGGFMPWNTQVCIGSADHDSRTEPISVPSQKKRFTLVVKSPLLWYFRHCTWILASSQRWRFRKGKPSIKTFNAIRMVRCKHIEEYSELKLLPTCPVHSGWKSGQLLHLVDLQIWSRGTDLCSTLGGTMSPL